MDILISTVTKLRLSSVLQTLELTCSNSVIVALGSLSTVLKAMDRKFYCFHNNRILHLKGNQMRQHKIIFGTRMIEKGDCYYGIYLPFEVYKTAV